MRGSRQGVVVTLAIVLAIGVVVLGSGRASGQGDIHVLIPAGGEGAGEIEGFEFGDHLTARAEMVDAATGESAGTAYLECTVVRRIVGDDQGMWRCSYHLKLAGGGIVLQGLDPRGVGASTFAVLGGTKAYAGASGDAVLTDSEAGTDIVITLA
jgi:hypothetical protein